MLNKINFYQFDNLVRNRVPFLFFNFSGESLVTWYTVLEKMHLQTYEILLGAEALDAELELRRAPRDAAIVLLCPDGKLSLRLYGELAAKGYTNVYVVDGGYRQMVTEKAQI